MSTWRTEEHMSQLSSQNKTKTLIKDFSWDKKETKDLHEDSMATRRLDTVLDYFMQTGQALGGN